MLTLYTDPRRHRMLRMPAKTVAAITQPCTCYQIALEFQVPQLPFP